MSGRKPKTKFSFHGKGAFSFKKPERESLIGFSVISEVIMQVKSVMRMGHIFWFLIIRRKNVTVLPNFGRAKLYCLCYFDTSLAIRMVLSLTPI